MSKEAQKEQKTEKKETKSDPLTEEKQRSGELTEQLQRLQAEFENHKKRTEKEMHQFMEYAQAGMLTELLPILDSFNLAIQNTGNKEEFVKGMQVLHKQFTDLLKRQGLEEIQAVDQQLDPHVHEVVMRQQSDKEPDTILEEFQKGYMLKERVLRHSKVKVSEAPTNDNPDQQANTSENNH